MYQAPAYEEARQWREARGFGRDAEVPGAVATSNWTQSCRYDHSFYSSVPHTHATQDVLRSSQVKYLSEYERKEILDFEKVYFFGARSQKKLATLDNSTNNHGYDDDRGDYLIVNHDHLAYRYEVVGSLGKGSFGQVLKCRDHRTGEFVAIKIIRNKKRFHHQALVEIKILENLREWVSPVVACDRCCAYSFSLPGSGGQAPSYSDDRALQLPRSLVYCDGAPQHEPLRTYQGEQLRRILHLPNSAFHEPDAPFPQPHASSPHRTL